MEMSSVSAGGNGSGFCLFMRTNVLSTENYNISVSTSDSSAGLEAESGGLPLPKTWGALTLEPDMPRTTTTAISSAASETSRAINKQRFVRTSLRNTRRRRWLQPVATVAKALLQPLR